MANAEQKRKDKLVEDLCYQVGTLNGRIISKNMFIAERIKLLYEKKTDATGQRELDLINEEIDWLKKLADI